NVQSGKREKVQVLIDGTDSAAAGVINKYLVQISSDLSVRLMNRSFTPPVSFVSRYLFNPELNSKWFSVPGIAVVIMAILCTLLTSLTVAREWEKGSMELLLSTPVKPMEIIIGKLLPYAFLSLCSVLIVYVLARLWFDVPFRGSHIIFILSCLIFLVGYLAIGLVISVVLRKQLTAMQAAMIVGLLPTNLLSGFIFSVENMPLGFQWFASVFPARWFMSITRDQFLKGSNIFQLATPIIAMSIISVILVSVAVVKFKGDLD
ncbi:MAG: ABC transporter permease, partial [Bdellovibrionales bacterium]|nr:ABC transporter permease [Bdellovibrionales bacterium]